MLFGKNGNRRNEREHEYNVIDSSWWCQFHGLLIVQDSTGHGCRREDGHSLNIFSLVRVIFDLID